MCTKAIIYFLLITSIPFSLLSCKPNSTTDDTFVLNVRLPNEPENLHPMLTKSSFGLQIASWILLPAAEFDPVTLKLSPLLLSEIPIVQEVKEGRHAGGTMYQLSLRPEAVWDNGQPVTSADYLFTMKAAFNPYITGSSWKGFFEYVSEIKTDPSDPKSLQVFFDSTYILALEAITNINIYPAHVYDPENMLAAFPIEQMISPDPVWTPEQDTLLKKFAASFQSVTFFRDTVQGAGPYAFESWTTGENIRIKRKENWWGDKIADAPLLLKAYPDEINYRFISDAATAEAALKSGEVDVLSEIPPADFVQMMKEPEWQNQFEFDTPAIMQIFYIEINQRDPILSDKKIRQALAYAIDYDGIMNNMLAGLGQRTFGPIHPQRAYYHKTLQPLEQDLNKSMALIKEAGWEDTNGNGTPDKLLNGKREELIIDIKITNKEEGQNLATIIKDNAQRVGITVNIVAVDPSQFTQDIRALKFDMAPMRNRPLASIDDLYPSFYSTSPANRSGIHHAEIDEVITDIRTSKSTADRDSSYYKLQELIYEEQPAIYLYVPMDRIIISKKFKTITTSRKPGYFENLFELAE